MDYPQTRFPSRWCSSKINSILPPSSSTSASPAPRYASTWDSFPGPSHFPVGSDIARRRPSETTAYSFFQMLDDGNIAPRKASVWDATTAMINSFYTSASPAPRNASTWDYIVEPSYYPVVSEISCWRTSETTADSTSQAPENSDTGNIAAGTLFPWDATAATNRGVQTITAPDTNKLDRRWDAFVGPPPTYNGSSYWGRMAKISAVSSAVNPAPPNDSTLLDRNRVYYAGNIDYIYNLYEGKHLAMADIEAVMYVYGVENTSALDIVKKIDPKKRGTFTMNPHNKQILLASTIKFSDVKFFGLSKLRHASKCHQDDLLSPMHYSGYIIEVLKGKYLGYEPRFMILGTPSMLGVLEGSTNRELTIKDVEKFFRLWKVNDSEEQDYINMIKDKYNGTISCSGFYNLLYDRNMYGKLHIKMFYILEQNSTRSFFPLMDKDEDGFLSSKDLLSFFAIFGQYPSDEAIDRVTRKFDMDGDGKISFEDFNETMTPILDGITWEFWWVAILITLDL